jgi:hypothetical protein
MANQSKLKAYVRYDGTGRVISGSLILQRFKPAVGNWVEIDASECCNYVPTTTTTTTATPTTTTTTTVLSGCLEYNVVVPDGGSGTLSGVDCVGNPFGPVTLTGPVDQNYCFESISSTGDVTITLVGPCNP